MRPFVFRLVSCEETRSVFAKKHSLLRLVAVFLTFQGKHCFLLHSYLPLKNFFFTSEEEEYRENCMNTRGEEEEYSELYEETEAVKEEYSEHCMKKQTR